MKVLLTSAGLETDEIQDYFMKLVPMDMASARALFVKNSISAQSQYPPDQYPRTCNPKFP